MDASWFCRIAERQLGPLSWVQLQRLAVRGELTPHSLVRRSDEITWVEAQYIPELWPATAPAKISDSTAPVDRRTPRATKPTPAPPPIGAAPKPTVPAGKPVAALVRGAGPTAAAGPAATAGPSAAAGPSAPTPGTVGLPAGLPVGVPVGVPVSAASGVESPVAPEIPLTFAPRPKSTANTAGDATVGAKAKGVGATGSPRSERKAQARTRLWILVGGVGGVLGVLLIIVVAVLAMGDKGGTSPADGNVNTANAGDAGVSADGATSVDGTGSGTGGSATVAAGGTTTSAASGGPGSASGGGAGPSTSGATTPGAAGATGTENAAKTTQPPAKDNPDAAARRILQSVAPWRDASSVRAVTSPSARIQFVGAWREGNRVCVEMRISNPQRMGEPLLYTSWNLGANSTTNPTAVLAAVSGDAAGTPLRFIPPGKAATPSTTSTKTLEVKDKTSGGAVEPSDSSKPTAESSADANSDSNTDSSTTVTTENERQTKSVRIAAGQSVGDVLEFEGPTGDFDQLQLALRLSAIGQGDRYLGFRIPRELVAPEKPAELAQPAETPRPPNPTNTVGAPADAPTTAGAGGDPAPTTAAPKEETIIDLKKQIEQDFKKSKEEKDKARRDLQERAKQKADGDDAE